MPTKPIPLEQMTLPKRFLTVEEFLHEYHNGAPIDLEVDPRIDLTKPIYEQAAALAREDEKAATATVRRQLDAS